MHRLQAVAHIRQGAGRDDRHGVFDEALSHLAAKLRDLELSAVDILARVFTTVDGSEALLKLLAVLSILLVRVILDIDVGALVVALRTGKQTLLVVWQPLVGRRVVHIICHVYLLRRLFGSFGDVFVLPHPSRIRFLGCRGARDCPESGGRTPNVRRPTA